MYNPCGYDHRPGMIEVQNLTKHYGPVAAIRDVSFSVAPGEIVGFLGPNGAGKSTTMRILSCFMPASSGSARVAGYDVFRESMEVRQRIGYLPGERAPLLRHARGGLSRLRGRGQGRRAQRAPAPGRRRHGTVPDQRRPAPSHRQALQGLPAAGGPGPGHRQRSARARSSTSPPSASTPSRSPRSARSSSRSPASTR